MSTITLAIPEDRMVKLRDIAARFNVTLEELVLVSIEELFIRPEDEFQRAVDYILTKNAELYRRLA